MQLFFGSYPFPVGGAELSPEAEFLWNAGEQAYAVRKRFHVRTKIPVNGQADATTQILAVQKALATPFQDLVFKQDSGASSPDVLLNAGSISGVRVVSGPNFPETRGAEYATYRTVEFTCEAEYPVAGSQDLLLSFRETLSFSGGEPLYAVYPAINGPPVRQMIYPQTPFVVVQEGEAVGYRSYPAMPASKWPGALKQAGEGSRTSPQRRGKGQQGYRITWRYFHESPEPMVGFPSVWNF